MSYSRTSNSIAGSSHCLSYCVSHCGRAVVAICAAICAALPLAAIRVCHRLYKLFLSPLIGNQCRFFPSCSDYALEAFERHGIAHGSILAAKRLVRCCPLHEGGLDPVPPPRK